MLESRNCYHLDEKGSKPYKWCVKFVVCGCDRGIVGMSSKQSAQEWLDRHLKYHENGRFFQTAL
jgi:hypothetical protein